MPELHFTAAAPWLLTQCHKKLLLILYSAKLSVVCFEMPVRKVHLSFKYLLGSLGSQYLAYMDSLV